MSNDETTTRALTTAVEAFNGRRYHDAAEVASRMLDEAVGRDEVFWMGMHETCRGFELIIAGQRRKAELEGALDEAVDQIANELEGGATNEGADDAGVGAPEPRYGRSRAEETA